jgi:synaptonemal complex protein 1
MPLDNIGAKSEKGKAENFVTFPKHSKKVTQHEYEVATSDGTKTITKRKRTRSTVMFGDASADVDIDPKKVNGGRKQRKRLKSSHPCPSTMGDLFGDGSLDPYADDPYAFG